ncbi:MAG TPA: bifunctional nuclease family protein, partial [Planctomycetota bacterium]|nr:bifunctional nuclease family protein [Planctomycetota bacterium]
MDAHLEKVKIKRIIGPTPSGAAVLLGNEKKTFVVFVGFYEAAALIREINQEVPARPLTHELIQNIFLGFDLEVKHVIISTILENTFCATLILQQKILDGKEEWLARRNEVRIDARPSDCFVLALKSKVDIFVTREVFDQVQDVSKMADAVEGSLASGGAMTAPGIGEIQFELGDGPDDSPDDPGEPSVGSISKEEAGGSSIEDPSIEDDDDDDDDDEDDDDQKQNGGNDLQAEEIDFTEDDDD